MDRHVWLLILKRTIGKTPSHWNAPPRLSPPRPETCEPGAAEEGEDGRVDSPACGPAAAAENVPGR